MNVDQLVNSSLKIQKKWLDNYDQNKLENEIPEVDIGNFFRDNIDDVIEDRLLDTYEEYDVLKNYLLYVSFIVIESELIRNK